MKRSRGWAIGLVVVGVLVVVGWRAAINQQHKKEAMAAASAPLELPIELAPQELIEIRPQPLALTVPVNGVVQAVSSAIVKAYVAGELRGLTVREGDSVKKGQALARVDATEAEARLRQAMQQADANKAQLAIAQRNHDNNAALVQKGFISTTALLTSQANLDTAKANLAGAQAAADAARKSVTDSLMTSPMNGQIAQRFVQNGERVGIEARIVEVVDPSQLEIMAQLAPADSVQVQVGQTAELTVPGTAADLAPIAAKVVRINPSAQSGSRTVAVYLAVQSAGENHSNLRAAQLRPGLFLQGNIVTGTASQLVLPLTSVRTDKPQPYVQVVQDQQSANTGATAASKPGMRVVHKAVTLGPQTSHQGTTWVQISSGLAKGERVLAGSAGGLREGTLVQIQAPVSTPTPVPQPAGNSSQAKGS